MSTISIFEKAARTKLRFDTPKGLVTVEDLFSLPLKTTTNSGMSLNDLAVKANQVIKASGDEDFVEGSSGSPNPADKLRFDILLRVIEIKVAENKAKQESAAKAERKQKILEIINEKQDAGLKDLSLEQLQAMIDDG